MMAPQMWLYFGGGILVAFLIKAAWNLLERIKSGSPATRRAYGAPIWTVGAAVLITVLIGFVDYKLVVLNTTSNVNDEIQTGLLVVASVSALMTLLFCIAAGFKALDLADVKQALGLPEGSIGAMIALILIQVFIIFGIYTFRYVSTGVQTIWLTGCGTNWRATC